MATCLPYGCYDNWTDIGEAELCPSRKAAGVNQAILLRCGVTEDQVVQDADPDALDSTKIDALIAAGDAKLVTGLQITINAPSGLSAPSGDPCIGESVINYDRSLTWQDYNVNRARQQFYDSINAVRGFPIGGVLLRHCSEDMVTAIFSDLKFAGGRQSPEQSTDAQFFEFEVTWRGIYDSEIFENVPDAFA